MPIYDYRCSACGHEVEVVHPIDGSGPERCEVCGDEMRKALSTPAIHFKGSGWAKKDARSAAKTSKPANGKDTQGADKTDSGAAETPDAKAGTTSEPASKNADVAASASSDPGG